MHLRLLYKKFLCVFMSLMIVIFSTQSAYATTSVGGWTALDTVTAGATNTINAAKTAGGKALKSAVTIAPSASKVGKHLIKGGGQAALVYAVVEILGEGIDWVLDPANNRIKYTEAADGEGDGGSAPVGALVANFDGVEYSSPSSLCAAAAVVAPANHQNPSVGSIRANVPAEQAALGYQIWDCGSPFWDGYWATPKQPPAGEGSVPEGKEKYIPIDTVAAQVISNAGAGHAPSQEAVKATALEGFAAGEHDAALDAAATEAGTQNPPDTENPPKDGEAVPFDPSSILAALSSISAILAGIMSALTGFVDWWQAQWATFSTGITEFFQWVRAEPDVESLKPEPVEVSEGTLVDGWQDKANAGYVNMGNTQCPADVLIPISYMGASTNLSLSYVPFCHFASIIRYAVILGAWVAALMIISGGRTRE